MNLTDFVKRADEILALGDKAISTFRITEYGGTDYNPELTGAFRSAGLAFLSNTFGEQHPYFRDFAEHTSKAYEYTTKSARGTLAAAREEVAGGWAVKTRGIVSAAIFASFIEMAEHLLDEGYKDPAAVLVGSTLEQHLRELAVKYAVPVEILSKGKMVPKKADVLNADLVKAGAYGMLQQKLVTAWLDLRNKAAHGDYAKYTEPEVRLMLQGVTQFMSQFPT